MILEWKTPKAHPTDILKDIKGTQAYIYATSGMRNVCSYNNNKALPYARNVEKRHKTRACRFCLKNSCRSK